MGGLLLFKKCWSKSSSRPFTACPHPQGGHARPPCCGRPPGNPDDGEYLPAHRVTHVNVETFFFWCTLHIYVRRIWIYNYGFIRWCPIDKSFSLRGYGAAKARCRRGRRAAVGNANGSCRRSFPRRLPRGHHGLEVHQIKVVKNWGVGKRSRKHGFYVVNY